MTLSIPLPRCRRCFDGILLVILLTACQPAEAVQTAALPALPPPPEAAAPVPEECAALPTFTQEGVASWYGRYHHGLVTANGEKFDMNALTAAHRKLPLGTRIRVTNLANGKTIELRINDRGPYVKRRILDVSRYAAQELGFTGTAKVRIETISICRNRDEQVAGEAVKSATQVD